MNNENITIGTVCFLINCPRNEILLLERSFEPMKGMMTGVGGKTKFDEDIRSSCIREIKEETGLIARHLKLKAVIKTILAGRQSSWILFVYITEDYAGGLIDCPEGKLHWTGIDELYSVNLIGFIRQILPYVLSEHTMIEGTIVHDAAGNVISKEIYEI